jgi:hypothetical protein
LHKGEKAQLNFPTKKEQAVEEAKQQRWIKCREAGSKYRGVSWNKNKNKWTATIYSNGKKHNLGYFEDEEEAARAYDRAARAHKGEKAQLNFPAEGESGPSRQSSKYRGVSWEKSHNKWIAKVQYGGKRHSLGYFEDEEEAARAYDRAARVHKGGRRGQGMKEAEKQTRKEEQVRTKAEAEKVREEAEEVRLLLLLSTPPGAQPSQHVRGKRATVRPKRYVEGAGEEEAEEEAEEEEEEEDDEEDDEDEDDLSPWT